MAIRKLEYRHGPSSANLGDAVVIVSAINTHKALERHLVPKSILGAIFEGGSKRITGLAES